MRDREALEIISEGRHPNGHRGAVEVAREALATDPGLDTDRMQRAFAEHEVEHHRVPRAEIVPIPAECLADVKERYDHA